MKKMQTSTKAMMKKSQDVSTSYGKWLEIQYLKDIVMFAGADRDEWISNLRLKYSSIARTNSIRLINVITISEVNSLVTTFKIKPIDSDISVTFGILFSENTTDKHAPAVVRVKNLVNKYYCASPSFVSCDGEYRRRLNNMYSLTSVIKNYTVEWEAIEDIITTKIDENNWILVEETFYPNDLSQKVASVLSYSIRKDRLAVNFLQASWFMTIYDHIHSLQENHINRTYTKILLYDVKGDIKLIKQLMDRFGERKINEIYATLNGVNAEQVVPQYHLEIGQKIIPLGLAEAQNPFNMRYKPWKELMIANRSAMLVVNGIACGVSISTKWLYIKNLRKGLFDNPIQYERMERGEIAAVITQQLADARVAAKANIVEHKESVFSESMLTTKFRELYDMIKDPVEYSKEELIMSNVALCIISEYVGKTFLDTAVICKRSKSFSARLGHPFVDIVMFKRYMFELCYNLYCLNRYMGVIHCDLHLNNVTIREKIVASGHIFSDLKNPHILFVMEEQGLKFLVPTKAYNLCIIDFSRSTIHRDYTDMYKVDYIEEQFSSMEHVDHINRNGQLRLIATFIRMFPDMIAHRKLLEALFVSKYDAMYRLMTSMDVYNFSYKARAMFKSGDKSLPKASKQHIQLLTLMITETKTMLRTEVNRIMLDHRHADSVLVDYPIAILMRKVFAEFIVAKPVDVDLVDIFVANGRKKQLYTLDNVDQFPPHLIHVKGIPTNKDTDNTIKSFNSKNKIVQKNMLRRKVESLKTVALIAKRHKEKNPFAESD
jgi:hypothetical protein